MMVSRETQLSRLLLELAKPLNVNLDFVNSEQKIAGLTLPALSLVLASINNKTRKPLLVLFDSQEFAESVYMFALAVDPAKVCYFPAASSGDFDISGFNLENERYQSEAVNSIRKSQPCMVFTTAACANSEIIDRIIEKEISFNLFVNSNIDRNKLTETLISWNYEQVDHTESPKTFSVRGGILDVFLPYSANPIRIEFFGNTIESIRLFNPRSQRTIKNIDNVEILPPPSLKNKTNKTSLMDLAANQSISVVTDGALFSIVSSSKASRIIDMDCSPVFANNRTTGSDYSFVQTLIVDKKINKVYLFSEKPPSAKLLEKYQITDLDIIDRPLESSFYSENLKICCLSINELNKQKPVYRSRWAIDEIAEIPQKEFSSLDELSWGDYLVHRDFGIGLYRGLEKRTTRNGVEQECIKIEYIGNAYIYVPVDKFNRVHRMIVTGNKEPILSALNSPKWARQKQTAKESAKSIVQELVDLYKSRSQMRGFKYNKNNEFMRELESSFLYEETSGQADAINAVFSDMENSYPVDRIVCGDVGFGKTEVALRAALKAIASGKKVLFLTPTTILADQHYISTKGRLEPLGVRVDLLSRFKTKKQQQIILEKMVTGDTDLVIGTHRLLSQDVQFPDLGMLIIDEEHRFGVKHKEKIRQLRSNLDVLTLTATPIPRTLQQSLLGVRDISRINTPPKTRQPIKTFVQYFNWSHIQTIINYELKRQGQVYFLHNDISSIPFIYKRLAALFPSAAIGVAHSKMNSKVLENTVLAFFDKKIDILLCTTIIESGLDVANANTLIINNAQNFGLSQLYQIRGRVGRSHRQAYCYLFLPQGVTIGPNARKRLKAIEQFTSLGSGYDISLKDLEIRGAGNLFGYKQSGHIATVGFEMYCRLIQEAVDEASNSDAQQKKSPRISIPLNAMIEQDYISLVQDRLHFYSQLSNSRTIKEVSAIESELVDRFGQIPEATKNLIYITNLRIKLAGSSVSSITATNNKVKISLMGHDPFSDIQELLNAVKVKMEINDYKHVFSTKPDELSVEIDAKITNNILGVIELIVELFSI